MSFIGIAGKNGFGVFNNEKRLENAKEYLTKASIKKCNSFYEAFSYARDVYNEYQDEFDNAFFGCSNEIKPNWILFRKDIRRINIED